MAKRIKEINNFGNGIILNASEKDIPTDSAAYSLNVEPDTKDGVLSGIKNNRFVGAPVDSFAEINYSGDPYVTGSIVVTPNNHTLPNPEDNVWRVSDFSKYTPRTGQVSYLSTKGDLTKANYASIIPHMERMVEKFSHGGSATTVTYATFKPTAGVTITKDDEEIVIGLTRATQTITFSGLPSDNDTIAIRSTANASGTMPAKTVTYRAKATPSAITDFDIGADAAATAILLAAAIQNEANHGSRLQVNADAGVITLIQSYSGRGADITDTVDSMANVVVDGATPGDWTGGEATTLNLSELLSEGDIIRFTTDTTNFELFHSEEIMRVIGFESDGTTETLVVERGYLGSKRKEYVHTQAYNIWINKLSINKKYKQEPTDFGYFYQYNYPETSHRQVVRGMLGGTKLTQNVTFSAANKTMTLASSLTINHAQIGHYFHFYKEGSLNHGSSFKVENVSTDGLTYYLGTAPVDETVTVPTELITVLADRDMSSDTTFWTDGTGTDYGTSKWDIDISSGGADVQDIITRADLLTVGKTYILTYEVKNYISGSVKAVLGTTSGTARIANGTYIEKIYCAGNTTLKWSTTNANSVAQDYSLDTFSIKEVEGYIESNLIKNSSFWHMSNTATDDWSRWALGGSIFTNNSEVISPLTSTNRTTTAGLYSDTNVFGAFNSSTTYPYIDNSFNLGVNLAVSYTTTMFDLNENVDAEQSQMYCDLDTGASGEASGFLVERNFGKGDIIKIDSELMKVSVVTKDALEVQRGYGNTIAVAHNDNADIKKCLFNGIKQTINKDLIKPDTEYEISFWVKGTVGVKPKAIITPIFKAIATITITDVTEINNGDKVNLIATDSTSHDFTAGSVAGGGTWIAETDNNTTATNLATQINANGKFSASADNAVVTVTQATAGSGGSTTVTLTDSGAVGMTKTNFTILSHYVTQTIALESAEGTHVTYQFYNEGSGYTNGTLDGNGNTIINLNGDSTAANISTTIKGAIDAALGHNGEIITAVVGDTCTIENSIGTTGNLTIESSESTVFTIVSAGGTVNQFDGGKGPQGIIGVTYNNGVFDSAGVWKENKFEFGTLGYGYHGVGPAASITKQWRYIDFSLLKNEYYTGSAVDSHLNPSSFQKLVYSFKTPLELPREDIEVAFASSGDEASAFTISQIEMLQKSYAVDASIGKGLIESTAFIDNALVMYDAEDSTIKSIDNFDLNRRNVDTSNSNILTSSSGTLNAPSTNNRAAFVNKNREVHMGFGSGENDANPQWLGYINHKVFGVKQDGKLYLDEDAIPQYDKEGINTLSKLAVAGEWEKVTAVYDATGTGGNNSLTLTLTGQGDNWKAGDNVVIREYLDTSNQWTGKGVWWVESVTTNTILIRRNPTVDRLPTALGGGGVGDDKIFKTDRTGAYNSATGYVSIRPFYYYGIKKGENYIYRITPEARITGDGASDFDTTVYKKGKIERSKDLGFSIQSICTSYSKNGTGTDGGYIYCLGVTGEKIYRVNVNVKYDEWKTTDLTIYETMGMKFRSFKWSNDNVNGNIGGTTGVYGGYAHSSSPQINPTGIPSDIIETKGPMITCDHDEDDNNQASVAPDKFDTRVWVQFKPPNAEDSFTEGNRFLFCGKSTFNVGSKTLYMADRTPPTTTLYGKTKWSHGASRYGNFKMENAPWHRADSTESRGSTSKGRNAYFESDNNENFSYVIPYDSFDFAEESPKKVGSQSANTANGSVQYPYVSFGYNVGWDCTSEDSKVSIKVARYGLFPIADNNGDGVLDGLGVMTPGIKYNAGNYKRQGNLHQRVSAHAVGLIGQTDIPWSSHAGRWSGYIAKNFSMASNSNGTPTTGATYSEDGPANMKMNRCIFTAADMHFGDMPTPQALTISSLAQDGNPGGLAASYYTRITTTSAHNLQAGDLVYFKGSGTWTGWSKSFAVIATSTSSTTQFWVSNASGAVGGSGVMFYGGYKMAKQRTVSWRTAYTGSGNPGTRVTTSFISYSDKGAGRFFKNIFHYAYNTSDGTNGEIFNSHGHFGPLWYTDQMNIGAEENHAMWPATQYRIERLNWLAGSTIRPFDMDSTVFNKLVLGNALSIDMPSFPAPVHRYSGTACIASTNSVGNDIPSKLFLTNPGTSNVMGDADDVQMYICNWDHLYPNKNSYIPIETGLLRWRRKTGAFKWRVYYIEREYNTNSINGRDIWEVSCAGYVDDFENTTDAGSPWRYDALHHPVVKLNMGTLTYNSALMTKSVYLEKNILAGLSITVVDVTYGTTQTRKIIASEAEGSNIWVSVHAPFNSSPVASDGFYIWKTSLVATAPVRLLTKLTTRFAGPDFNKLQLYSFGEGYASGGSGDIASGLFTCANDHGLVTGDKIIVDDSDTYDGAHTITVKSPLKFQIVSTGTTETGCTWKHPVDSTNASANPITMPLLQPSIKMMYGGLDFRKSIQHSVTTITDQGDEIQLSDAGTALMEDHTWNTGDQILVNSSNGSQNGSYIMDKDHVDAVRVDNIDHSTGTATIYQDGWGGIGASSTGASVVGDIGCNHVNWDKGDRAGNVNRYDATDNSRYINVTEVSFKIASSAPKNQPEDYFLKNQTYRYKLTLIYDGYQEGPLSEGSWLFEDSASRASLDITVKIKKFSKRLTAVCVYRKDTPESFYRLVKQISTSDLWAQTETSHVYNLVDDGKKFGSFEARTGISEINNDLAIKYGFATELGGYLFAGDCSHRQIKNATNMIFRSKPGQFSKFDWASDFVQLKAPPTAMVGYLGKLWVFDNNNIYKINPFSLAIEDVFEGIGCSGPNSLISTEFGMFFANRSGAYFHNGAMPKKISAAIQKGGETNMLTISSSSTSETTNVEDLSWNNTAGNIYNKEPYVTYDAKRNAVYFLVEFKDDDGKQSQNRSYIWVFSIDKSRWDLWELATNDDVGKPFLGKNGEVYIGIGNGLYEITGSPDNKKYSWLSKKLVMDAPSIKKVFTKVKINGTTKALNVGDDKLIVATDTGRVLTSDIAYKKVGNDSADYKLSSKMKTGKWCQFKLEDIESELDSIAIIYRLRSVK